MLDDEPVLHGILVDFQKPLGPWVDLFSEPPETDTTERHGNPLSIFYLLGSLFGSSCLAGD